MVSGKLRDHHARQLGAHPNKSKRGLDIAFRLEYICLGVFPFERNDPARQLLYGGRLNWIHIRGVKIQVNSTQVGDNPFLCTPRTIGIPFKHQRRGRSFYSGPISPPRTKYYE